MNKQKNLVKLYSWIKEKSSVSGGKHRMGKVQDAQLQEITDQE